MKKLSVLLLLVLTSCASAKPAQNGVTEFGDTAASAFPDDLPCDEVIEFLRTTDYDFTSYQSGSYPRCDAELSQASLDAVCLDTNETSCE